MSTGFNSITPFWPNGLEEVDIVRARFVLDFLSSCVLHPADFIKLGRLLKVSAKHFSRSSDRTLDSQLESLFEPKPSSDPVARKRYQKPAPAFVMSSPINIKKHVEAGDRLELDVLFLGNGVTLIHVFLNSLIHVGHLGMSDGHGHFEVTEIYTLNESKKHLAWRQGQATGDLIFNIQPLLWLVARDQISNRLRIVYDTPCRLLSAGRLLRSPGFNQVFPFILRRVTSMLFTHANLEIINDSNELFAGVDALHEDQKRLVWSDWRSFPSQNRLTVGGFTGEMTISGPTIEIIYWVLTIASLLGIGKWAAYGSGRFRIEE